MKTMDKALEVLAVGCVWVFGLLWAVALAGMLWNPWRGVMVAFCATMVAMGYKELKNKKQKVMEGNVLEKVTIEGEAYEVVAESEKPMSCRW